MFKKIRNTNSQINISVDNNNFVSNISIEKAYLKDDSLDKTITLLKTDDMKFTAYKQDLADYSDLVELEYEVTIEDKIYFALNRLLGNNDEMFIDDDFTRDEYRNYLIIKRKQNKIVFIFHDEDIQKLTFERFNVFIINIVSDGRSKIKDINTKSRLLNFFKEASEILLSDNHQYTLDEYYEILKSNGIYTEKNPFIVENEETTKKLIK